MFEGKNLAYLFSAGNSPECYKPSQFLSFLVVFYFLVCFYLTTTICGTLHWQRLDIKSTFLSKILKILVYSIAVQFAYVQNWTFAWKFNVSVKSKLQHLPPRHLTFLKIIVQVPPYPGQNAIQMPHTWVHSGDQMPPQRGHFTGT